MSAATMCSASRRSVGSTATTMPSTAAAAAERIVMRHVESTTAVRRRAEVMCNESAVLRNYEMIVIPSAVVPVPAVTVVAGTPPTPVAPTARRVIAAARVHWSRVSAVSITSRIRVVASRESEHGNNQRRQRYKFDLHIFNAPAGPRCGERGGRSLFAGFADRTACTFRTPAGVLL